MATSKQNQANRQNAQRSTGPRSVEGKAASRFNALKTGIDAQAQVIPGEDPDQLADLVAAYQEPVTTPERPEQRATRVPPSPSQPNQQPGPQFGFVPQPAEIPSQPGPAGQS